MLDTFKAQLKAKARTLGVNLSQKRIDALADRLHKKHPDLTEEADHLARIDELHDLQPLDEIARQDDQIRTLDANKGKGQQKQEGGQEGGQNNGSQEGGQQQNGEETPAWAKALIQEVQTLKAEKTQATLKQQASAKLKDVPEVFWKRAPLPEKEEDLDNWAEEIKADYSAFAETQNTASAQRHRPPAGSGAGGGTAKPSDAEVKELEGKFK